MHDKLLVFLIIVLSLFVTGCSNQTSTELQRQSLIFCSDGAPDNFNPSVGTSFTNFNASSRVLFNRLLTTDNTTGKILPSLALRWEKSSDNLIYQFELKENIAFHSTNWFQPTRTLNADDVIYSFQRQADAKHPFHKTDSGTYNYFQSTGLNENLIRIERLGDHQIAFHLRNPDSSFLYTLSMDFASIISKEYADFILDNNIARSQFDRLPIGTGPYKLNKYQDNSFIRYYAHPHYFSGKSDIEHLIYAITPDPSTRYARLVSGECDVMLNPPNSQYALLQNNKDIQLLQRPGLNIGFMVFNINQPPLDDLRVRQAITMAINKKRLVDKVYGELGNINHSLLPPAMTPYHNPDLRTADYDPGRARELLAELGLENIRLNLWALPVQRSYNPNGNLMAELIQEDLKAIGITTKIISYEWSTHLEKVKNGEHDLALLGWVADNYNPTDFLNALISCSAITSKTNRTFWCSQVLDNLLVQTNKALDQDSKVQDFYQIQSIIAKQLPLLPVATGQTVLLARKTIKGIEVQTLGGISFTNVSKEIL